MAHSEGWEIGMTVCVVTKGYSRRDIVSDGVIAKIGRRWITLSGANPYRFDAETMALDGRGYSSPGRVYVSRNEYECSAEAYAAWVDLMQRLSHQPPKGMSAERIREIAEELLK